MGEEDVGIVGVKMKFANTNRTGNGEGKPLCTYTCLFQKKNKYRNNLGINLQEFNLEFLSKTKISLFYWIENESEEKKKL